MNRILPSVLTVIIMPPAVEVDVFRFEIDSPTAASASQPVCGGRRFKRRFTKRDFPLLGDDDGDETGERNAIVLSGRSRHLVPKVRACYKYAYTASPSPV